MKKIFALLSLIIIVSCGPRVDHSNTEIIYDYATRKIMPDSNKIKMAEWITKTVSATNFHMTGGDYEDPEDMIDELEDVGEDLFSVEVEGLYQTKTVTDKYGNESIDFKFIEKSKLNEKQLVIFYKFKNE